MRLIDIYFKAFNKYRSFTAENSQGVKIRRVIKQANVKDDSLTITKYECDVEDEWIRNIEEGLIFIEKAIKEERQFIRTEGEIVRIEKVKKTSKATVEHLSRNSNFITRVPKEGDPIIPDKLYIVEKLNDYAVYENRFLYLLLTYLRDFTYSRLEKIKDKITTYEASMFMNKQINLNNRNIKYELNFSDHYKNDPHLMSKYKDLPIMERLEVVYYQIETLLGTHLMIEVAKAPVLTPPIVKTNVLRMNPNFRAALNLYDYIMAYNKPGYSFREVKKVFNPFIDEMSDEIADVVELTTFIAYKYGNEIKEELQEVLLEEEAKEKIKANKEKQEELRRMQKRVREKGVGLEDYILLVEKRNQELEKENLELIYIKQNNEELQQEKQTLILKQEQLNSEINNLNELIVNKNNQLDLLNDKYIEDMTKASEQYRLGKQKLIDEFAREKANLQEEHLQNIKNLQEEFNQEKLEIIDHYERLSDVMKEEFEIEKESIITKHENIENKLNEKIILKENEIVNLEEVNKTTLKQMAIFKQEKDNALGRYYALKQKHDLLDDSDKLTSKEEFKALEATMRSFNKFFKEQWRQTKAQIRRDIKEESRQELLKEQEEKNNKVN